MFFFYNFVPADELFKNINPLPTIGRAGGPLILSDI